jgi:hypothetical protein
VKYNLANYVLVAVVDRLTFGGKIIEPVRIPTGARDQEQPERELEVTHLR